MRGCLCLCIANHPDDRGICNGDGETTMRFATDDDLVDVEMCQACANATWNRKIAILTQGGPDGDR